MAQLVEQRERFVAALNAAFGAAEIEATRAKLGSMVASMDALEIVHRLGLLTWVPVERFFTFRDRVGIPAIHVQVLTLAFHRALLSAPGPIPLKMTIVEGPVESVAVSAPHGHIAVTLTRTAFEKAD